MPRPFEKVLVANRGEIARRVFAGCRSLGMATVAIHSEADADAPFVAEAGEAVPLGGRTAAESYLDVGKVLRAAELTGAGAVHPGYGFLAENAAFAAAVADAGLVWIGPPPAAIEAMGSKVRARSMMEAAGVPIVPGRELASGDDVAAAGGEVGYPLLVKASAGGGGKGMRPVASAAELEGAIEGARREAESAFGDPTVFLERYLQKPRHIEIQVLADSSGNVVSLGERECSVQRRHQKVLEEAPSVAVGPQLREALGSAAVDAARAVDYVGAGTVEFLLDQSSGRDEFFFLEMNTRLQVEHPVTEMVLGLDLVAEQLRIASGEGMSETAAEPRIDGHAIEVRLYAEDAAGGFLPQTGTVERISIPGAEPFAVPAAGARAAVRLDSGVEDGTVVGPDYDPMLAKVIAWAPDREVAAARLAAALRAAELDGLVTNRDFLVNLLGSESYLTGATDTGLLEREPEIASEPLVDGDDLPAYAAAAALAAMAGRRGDAPVLGFAPPGFRNNFSEPQRTSFATVDGSELAVTYAVRRSGVEIAVGGEALDAPRIHGLRPDAVDLEVGGVRRRYAVRRSGEAHHVNGPSGQADLRELPRYPSGEDSLGEGALVAPMPGKVIKLAVSEGSKVEAGDVLVVLEAMKMEHELTAPAAGTLAELRVAEGDQVDAGSPLAVIS